MSKLAELMRECIRSVDEVQELLQLDAEEAQQLKELTERYPLCITPYYLSLVDPADRNDPIRKMCFPDLVEYSADGAEDTSGEAENTVIRGMQHKYAHVALILSTNQCAMYCRHCFRKRMVGYSADEIAAELPAMAEYIGNHPEIINVLISGGDAFINSNETIRQYLETFTAIPTLQFIRFGTRTPVVLPQRISEDEELLQLLAEYGRLRQIIIVTQFNHPNELTAEAAEAVQKLRAAGCIVRNQTVLLRGVNDDAATLAALMNGLVKIGVIPYYIFQCRPVVGVKSQFQVPLLEGVQIVEEAKLQMSGQAKSCRYAMSHPSGKIEILGADAENNMLFKYHQAKYAKNHARIFCKKLAADQCWLPDDIDA